MYFGELGSFSPVQWIMFPIGVLVIVLGVIFMSSRKMKLNQENFMDAGYNGLKTPDTCDEDMADDMNLELVLEPFRDPVYTPAANEMEVTQRSSLAEVPGFSQISHVQWNGGSRVSKLSKTSIHSSRPCHSSRASRCRQLKKNARPFSFP